MPGIDLRSVAGGVAVITIDRPEKANALDSEMHYRLTTVWRELQYRDDVGAIVLTGRGRNFCGGGDRSKWADLANDRRYRRGRMAEARELIRNMLYCELPIVAAVNGPAMGVGCSMVLACDLVLMAEDAYLADPHVSAGIVAGDGGAALLPELLPLPLARRLLYTASRLGAREAQEVHFASEVVPADRLLDRSIEVAREMAAMPWEAMRDTKRVVNLALMQRAGMALEIGSTAEGASLDSPDFAPGQVSE
jgi:enoyl-CoA hydratase/carnithine racemase